MAAYLNLATFKNLTLVPSSVIDRVETKHPGWIDAQLEAVSSEIDAQLAKRYEAPFQSPYPLIVKLWLSRIVSASVYDKHGTEALEQQAQRFYDAEKAAKEEIAKAADAEKGLYELPLRADTTANGVTRGGPRSYSEAGPYSWTDQQRRTARGEDQNGEGTRRG
jgi:phage gp36-like protein